MKKLFLLFITGLLLISCGVKTPYDSFRKEHKEDIAFSLGASNFLANMFMNKEDVRELKQVVDGISKYRVLVAKEESSAYLNNEFKKLVHHGYEQLFYVNDKGNTVNLYFFKRGGKIKELIVKVKDNNDFVILSAEGNIKIKDLHGLINRVAAN
ncbi:DUF4252 domain-containing protein [Zhouia sp. PK063]|uniref:DUF4252 domain-containing protein n=1 Tax=Zhouia sp. PK063 TaxID=3373602 RepID=UPI0037B38DBD